MHYLARIICILGMILSPPAMASEFHRAAADGDMVALERLFQAGQDIDERDEARGTALIAAALAGQQRAVALLLERGAAIDGRNDRGLTPLHAASYGGHAAVVALLLDKGAAIDDQDNKFGITPLHAAAEENHVEVLELLIESGAALEAGEANGYTALTRAGWKENWQTVEVLLKAGAQCQPVDLVGEWWAKECPKRMP